MKDTIVCNLYGGPGTGKSTTAAGVFSELKLSDINAELVTEYAKDKVWEGSHSILEYQIYVFGKQLLRIQRLLGKVDVIVTDSPLLLSVVYGKKESQEFQDLVISEYNKMNNLDVYLLRGKKYNESGRLQTENQARILDGTIKLLLDMYAPEYRRVVADRAAIQHVSALILNQFNEADSDEVRG